MLRAVLSNLRARALRTALTVGGIAIGILALVVVGSLAERLQTIVVRSTSLNGNAIFAVSSGFDRGGNPLADDSIEVAARQIRHFRGVRDVVPEVVLPFGITPGGANGDPGRFGPPVFVFGFPPAARQYQEHAPKVVRGRDLGPTDIRAAVVGPDFAAAAGVDVGATFAIYGNSYHVVGIVEKSFTVFDAAIVVPYASAQRLILQDVPPQARTLPHPSATALMILTASGVDTGLIARRIGLVTSLTARDPKATAASFSAITSVFDAIIFGAALIALIVGAFSIVNTMTIAVTERMREIGIRKAIGASDSDILREFLIEAAVIGALGALAGVTLGAVIIAYVNARNAGSGSLELFALTPRLVAGSFIFAVVLSMIAGLFPALSAARLDPTQALRRSA